MYLADSLYFPAGSKYKYSNTGYVVLASLVEVVSGTPFPDFVKNRIFSPLGMNTSMYFGTRTEKQIPGRALGYGPWPWLKVGSNQCVTSAMQGIT
jgi:CubicO group peptidase (beta-lactamase class C family)